MWIRSQDKKDLVNVVRVSIASIWGDKKNKVIIWGHLAADTLFTSNRVSLGMYPTMEDALSQIDEIEKHILANDNGVYQMKTIEK